jgi:DNA (cytosine-5)-methyltransferase 1
MIRAVDFFCGGGGMSFGMTKAGIRVLAGIDIDVSCRATYEANNPDSRFIARDIGRYLPEELEEDIGIKQYDDNLIFIGCSPCQYWSLLKTDKTKSKKTAFLLKHFEMFVEYFRPGFVVIENVPGMIKRADSPINSFRKFLEKSGYRISENIVNANDYGVPQNRRRFVLIAGRVADVAIPKPNNRKKLTVSDVLGPANGFPPLAAGQRHPKIKWHIAATLSNTNLHRLAQTPIDGGMRSAWKDNNELQLEAYKNKDDQFGDVYGRMFWNRPAPTITTRFISISNGRFAHPAENRGISIREGACLQSFPKRYRIEVSGLQDAARIIGNAVPPKLAEALGKAILSRVNHE